jgi:hexosaminidase
MPYDLIEEGFKVINSSWVPMYVVPNSEPRFSWGIPEILAWNVYNWQHWYEHSEAFLNPITVSPTEQVIGATLCLWECTFEEEIYRGINNLTAMSERVWTVKRLWNDQEFFNRARFTIHRIARLIQNV